MASAYPQPEPTQEPQPEPQPELSLPPEPEPEAEPEAPPGHPYYLFPYPGVLEGRFIDYQAYTFGVAFAVELIIAIAVLVTLRRHLLHDSFGTCCCVAVIAGLRALFFIVDPWHAPERLQPLVLSYVFGIPFPMRNAMTIVLFFSLRNIATATQAGRTIRRFTVSGSQSDGGRVLSWWGGTFVDRVRAVAIITTVCELSVQVFADTMRSRGCHLPILRICKAFFVAWGGATAVGFSLWTFRLRRIARHARIGVAASNTDKATTHQRALNRLCLCFWACATAGLTTAVSSAVYLAVPTLDVASLTALYTLDHSAELLQCAAALLLIVPKAAARHRAALALAESTKQQQGIAGVASHHAGSSGAISTGSNLAADSSRTTDRCSGDELVGVASSFDSTRRSPQNASSPANSQEHGDASPALSRQSAPLHGGEASLPTKSPLSSTPKYPSKPHSCAALGEKRSPPQCIVACAEGSIVHAPVAAIVEEGDTPPGGSLPPRRQLEHI